MAIYWFPCDVEISSHDTRDPLFLQRSTFGLQEFVHLKLPVMSGPGWLACLRVFIRRLKRELLAIGRTRP